MSIIRFYTDKGWRMLSPYGRRTHPVTGEQGTMHWGVDFGVPDRSNPHEPVPTPFDGTVVAAGMYGTRGNTVSLLIKGSSELILFQHLASFPVKKGNVLKKGDMVGICGNTGRSTGIHLHVEIKIADGTDLGGRVWGDPADYRITEVEAKVFNAGDRVVSNLKNSRLNVRERPGGRMVGQLEPGETTVIVEDSDNSTFHSGFRWFRIEKGWVVQDYIERTYGESDTTALLNLLAKNLHVFEKLVKEIKKIRSD